MVDLSTLSRKDLQALAKEFQLCRGNAKSDVILQHVQDFVRANSADGEQRVRQTLGLSADDAKDKTPAKTEQAAATKPSPAKSAREQAQEATEKVLESAAEAVVADARDESSKKTKTPEKKTPDSALKPATKMPPKSAPANKSPAKEPTSAKKSPAKKPTPAKKSQAKASPKQQASRPALTPLDNNVVKGKASASKTATGTVDSLVSSIDDLVYSSDGGKVRCTTTGHEMKADKDVITAYISGKSYQRARAKKQSFASYAPMFTVHPDEKKAHLLWCHVTETEHPRDVERIEAHIQAARYQKELPRWQEAEAARAKAEADAAARAAAKAKVRAEKVKQFAAKTEDDAPQKKSKARKRKHRGSKDGQEAAADGEPARQRARVEQ